MNKYAEIYGGKVRDIKESTLNYIDFCSIWEPTSYWIDVTGISDIDIGWIIKFDNKIGTYFEKPEELLTSSNEDLYIIKRNKLEKLNVLFQNAVSNAYVKSSLGFNVDANEEASRNVNGLITLLENSTDIKTINFCDYNNNIHELSLSQLKILELEIIKNGSNLYQQKWDFRDKINSSLKKEELNNIEIVFYNLEF